MLQLIYAVFCALVLLLPAQAQMPPSLWKWPNSSSYINNTGPPDNSKSAAYNGISGCVGGGDENYMSWSCPHLMLLSPDMQFAAQADKNYGVVYAVAGIGQASDCGKCYQLKINDSPAPQPSTIIVQAVNTGSDVSSGQFDILLGAGGFGIYDACSSDCKQKNCGQACNGPMYAGDFSAWTPDGNCYGGGLKDESKCGGLVNNQQTTFADKTLVYGCKTAIDRQYHQNYNNVDFQQVQCPKSLYLVSGIRSLSDDSPDLPMASPHLKLQNGGRITTTMDCCKPTCAWRQNTKGYTDSNFPSVYVCNKSGIPIMNMTSVEYN